ncbi:MAG: toxin of the YafQ-DinJ toxin-antitoxin system [Candidatus Levybacteria bacterium]|nr:toxin of the YafQ-DinJ toxin-antitoxin system [Candidatus Levybacteria bacterium]
MIIRSHRNFKKQLDKLTKSQKEKFKERSNILIRDEFHPILNNHALKGGYGGCRSINVGGDLRAIYIKSYEGVLFIAIGSHSKLYG